MLPGFGVSENFVLYMYWVIHLQVQLLESKGCVFSVGYPGQAVRAVLLSEASTPISQGFSCSLLSGFRIVGL